MPHEVSWEQAQALLGQCVEKSGQEGGARALLKSAWSRLGNSRAVCGEERTGGRS